MIFQRALKAKMNLKLAKQKGAVALEKKDHVAAYFCYLEVVKYINASCKLPDYIHARMFDDRFDFLGRH